MGVTNSYTLINEGNLYRLVIKSTKSEAEPFEEWVFNEVLPSIRKTGGYGIPDFLKPIIEPITLEDFNWRHQVIVNAFANLENAKVVITLSGTELLIGNRLRKSKRLF